MKSLSDVSKLLLYVLILLYNYFTIPYYGISLLHLPCASVFVSRSVVSDSLRPHRLQLPRLLCPRNFPGNNTGAGCHALLHRIFLTQGLNPGLPHCRQILYHLNHQGNLHSSHHYFNFLLSYVSVFYTLCFLFFDYIILLKLVGCFLILFMVSFAVQRFLSLIKSHLFIFAFTSIAWGD